MGNVKGTTKSGGQKHLLDKFYTKPEVASGYILKADSQDFTTIIEPSAGSGAFSNQIPNCIALDLEPEGVGIIQQDWFDFSYVKKEGEKVLVIGNPPFGQQNSLAVRFINHAAKFADRIAFILPISFMKASVQARIDLNMHLTHEEELPKDSFTFNDESYDVKCVFQIWDRKDTKREKQDKTDLNTNNLFDFVKKDASPDAAIQRVGGNAGKATSSYDGKSMASNYFIRFKNQKDRDNLKAVIESLNAVSYPSRDLAVGPRSISKSEMNTEINKNFS